MTWTNNFFLILTLTVTASCFLGLWSLGEKKWEKDGWTALASYLLYGVVLLHLVPVAYIIIMRSMEYGQFGWKYGWNCIRNDRKSGENNRIQWVLLDYWNGGIFVKICPG